jgi:tRNA threonylcarbamoyl adenosine modification protein YeaZ
MMLILAIEVSNPSSCGPGDSEAHGSHVALGRQGEPLLGIEPVELGGRDKDDLLPAIDRLCRRSGVVPRDLGLVAVDVGPGGFTGLRVAVAASAAMAEALGIGVVAVPAGAVAAIRAREGGTPFAVVLATKGESGYVQRFDGSGVPLGLGELMNSDGLAGTETQRLIADRFMPDRWRAIAAEKGWGVEGLELRAESLLQVVQEMGEALVKRPVGDRSHLGLRPGVTGLVVMDPAEVRPLYAREPEAVTLWEARKRAEQLRAQAEGRA